jgi:hypothetical protein
MIKEKRNYNKTHPELREGEMLLTNCSLDNYDYDRIGWNTKRRGRHAYTIDGKPFTGYIPVFVQIKEYEEGMKKYREEEI